jgi:hypothetical protein
MRRHLKSGGFDYSPHKWLGAYKAGKGFQTPHEHKEKEH